MSPQNNPIEQQASFHSEISTQHHQGPSKTSGHESRSFQPFNFMPNTEHPPEKLSPLDVITCQNVEVFKATAGDVADHEGTVTVNKGQVGFRCIHCAKNPFAKAEYSSVFPGSLGSLAASLQLMTKIHFSSCMALDQGTRSRLQAARDAFSYGDDDQAWFSEAFVEYALDKCKKMNIVNRYPPQTGLVLGQDYRASKADSASTEMNKTTINTSFKTPESEHFAASMDMRDSGRSHGSGYNPQMPMQEMLHPILGTTPTSSAGSPPSLYDSPGSPNYPFFQNQQGFWECRSCWGYPHHQRPQGCIWQSTQPPNPNFIESHMGQCNPQIASQYRNYSQPSHQNHNNMYHQPNHQYDNMNQSWLTPKNRPNHYGQSHSQPTYMSPRSSMRPPLQHPPSAPSHLPSDGMSPQEAYAYQQMQMYNQMQMQRNEYGYRQHGYQHEVYPGQPVDYMMYNNHHQRNAMERSNAQLKDTIEYLEKEEDEIKARLDKVEDEEERNLIVEEDKSLLTDYFFHVMKQLRYCRFTENDRKTRGGKRENIAVGFGGLKCVHCAESQNSRKFFWSNVDRLANSFAEIPGHVLKCRRCPNQTKQALQILKQRHPEQMTQLPRGSQKVFFRRMWRRLHDSSDLLAIQASTSDDKSIAGSDKDSSLANGTSEAINADDSSPNPEEGALIMGVDTESAGKALAEYAAGKKPSSRILLAIEEDKEWLSDMDCFVRSNLELFCASKYDIEFAESDQKYPITEGQIGVRCIHCAMSAEGARGTAVSFPPFVNGIYECVREFHRVHLPSCPCLPDKCKEKLASLKGSSSLSSVLRRYYVEAAEALGIYDTDEGMRSGGEVKPIGKKEGSDKGDLTAAIHHYETANHDYMNNMNTLGQLAKRRRLDDESPFS